MSEYVIDGRFLNEGISVTVYERRNMDVVDETWWTWDEVDEMKSDEESHFTFEVGDDDE